MVVEATRFRRAMEGRGGGSFYFRNPRRRAVGAKKRGKFFLGGLGVVVVVDAFAFLDLGLEIENGWIVVAAAALQVIFRGALGVGECMPEA